MKIDLIVVGKYKDKNFESIENEFLKRISKLNFNVHELKSNSENQEQEASLILKKLEELKRKQKSYTFALTEKGKKFDSPQFSKEIFNRLEAHGALIFIIAGAYGFHSDVLEQVDTELSLSPLTFPHKFARLIFIEQLYRGMTINDNHPYHN